MKDELKLKRLCPNMITMTALCFGVSSLNMAYWGQWQMALTFIILAGIFDFLDGKIARMLGVGSHFGEELDSLSDFVSFGVAPGFLMYQWTLDQEARINVLQSIAMRSDTVGILQNIGMRSDAVGISWVLVLFMAMCCAMRLARFNAMIGTETPPYWRPFFMGVPAPAGAGLAVWPLICSLATGGKIEFFRSPICVGTMLALSGLLMASKIPTICLKHLHLSEGTIANIRIALMLAIAGLVWMPWITLSLVGLTYVVCMPLGVIYFLKTRHTYLVAHPARRKK